MVVNIRQLIELADWFASVDKCECSTRNSMLIVLSVGTNGLELVFNKGRCLCVSVLVCLSLTSRIV